MPCGFVDPEQTSLRSVLAEKKVGMVLDLSRSAADRHIRRAAVDFVVPLFTDLQQIKALGKAMDVTDADIEIAPYSDYEVYRPTQTAK